jgi:hypothetical protein
MTRQISQLTVSIVLTALVGLYGCNGSTPGGDKSAGKGHSEADGHDHGKEGHDHAHEGPHHFPLIDLGEGEYHAELAHDDSTKTVTVYLLDKEAKNPVAIADPEITLNLVVDGKPLQAKLTAKPQEGDPEGQASRFTITDEKVLEAHDAPKTTGRLNVTINGKAYSGAVESHEHGEHKH